MAIIQGFFAAGRPVVAARAGPAAAHHVSAAVRPPGGTVQARAAGAALSGPGVAGGPSAPLQLLPGGRSHELDPAYLTLRPHHAGRPLPAALQASMEKVLGADLSAVRIHLGPEPAAIGAQAFTTGNDIYVSPERYAPHSLAGQRLLGHELAHVVQQRQGRVQAPQGRPGLVIVQDPRLEREAEEVAARVATRTVLPRSPHVAHTGARPTPPGRAVQRMKRDRGPGDGGKKLAPVQKKQKVPKDLILHLLTQEILLYIFEFLSDLDIVRLFQVSKVFHEMALKFYLAPSFYGKDDDPIVGRGMSKGTSVTATEHYSHAAAAFRLALQIRNRTFNKGKVPRIMLYRVSDKKSLTSSETMALTVPGSPLNSKGYIPGIKELSFYNFQVSGKEKSFWSVEKTAAWILGGIVARLPFVLVTDATNEENFKEGDVRKRGVAATVAIYAREIMQLLSAGYTLGFARKGEIYGKGTVGDVLVLRPPYRTRSRSVLDEMGSSTSHMSRVTIWDRSVKDPKTLTIVVNGRTISASDLASYITGERELLLMVAKLLASVEVSDEEGPIPEPARRRRSLSQLIQSTGGDVGQLRNILGRLSRIERASLRESYQDDLDLVLGYEGRPDAEIQVKVIEIIDEMDGKI